MIIDNHAHTFPYLGGKSEYKSKEIQLMYAQKLIAGHFETTHRMSDFSIVRERNLWDKDKPGQDGMRNVDFRAGKFGRYEWTINSVDYCLQFMPVSLQNMTSPAEFLIAQMDYIGIGKAVLQRAHIYGKLENYYHEAIKKFPDRFIGLAQIDESRAYYDDQISELHRAIDKLGLKGVYFEPGALFVDNFKHNFDDEVFDTFWQEIDSLSIPVYVQTDRSEYLDQMKRWERILAKYPSITLVVSLGLPEQVALKDNEVHIPEIVRRLVTNHKVYLEVADPISVGKEREYPYPTAQKIIRRLYEAFGPEKLVWGSDIPNVERCCIYAQSLDYLKNHCNFLSESDKELILGKNVMRIFNCVKAMA